MWQCPPQDQIDPKGQVTANRSLSCCSVLIKIINVRAVFLLHQRQGRLQNPCHHGK